MADIKHITLPNGDTHDLKDASIRDEVQFKIYDSVTDLGLTSGSATILGAFDAMENGSILITPASEFSSTEVPHTNGVVQIVKRQNGYSYTTYYALTTSVGDHRKFISGGKPSGDWKRLTPKLSSYTIGTSSMPSIAAGSTEGVTSSVDWPGSDAFIYVTYPGSTGLVVVNTFESSGKIRFSLRNITSNTVTPSTLYFKVIAF